MVVKLAKQFAKAMAHWAAKGFPTSPKKLYKRRRQICHKCAKGRGWCPVCNCNINFKCALLTERCPEGKW